MSPTLPELPSRRTFLAQSLVAAGMVSLAPATLAAPALLVANVTGLYSVEVARIETPRSTQQVAALVRAWPGKVCVGGGRFSMGGQVGIAGGLHLDLRTMNQLVWFKPRERLVRVQAGMRWRDLQDVIDRENLAVKTMQSYANFTVGGAVSVNAHGRYVGHGPVGNTVRAIQLVVADGSIVEASPAVDRALFQAAIGGYGAVGVIVEVELELADNVRIEKTVLEVPLERYVAYFEAAVGNDGAAILHNADLVPPTFDAPVSVTWRESTRPLTEQARLIPRGRAYSREQVAILATTELPYGERLRKAVFEPRMRKPAVTWLNHEASRDVAELEPWSRRYSTYVLQEYFVPKRNFLGFVTGMAALLRRYHVEALNVSIRHSPADTVSLMPWAKEEVFAFVLYYKQRTDRAAQERVTRWTRELIGLALTCEGRYYLPYQPAATVEQFHQAYPEAAQMRALKEAIDPGDKFSNSLWDRYR